MNSILLTLHENRTLLGKDFRVKGLVGLSSIRADAEERGVPTEERWFEGPNVPESSEGTGERPECPRKHNCSSRLLESSSLMKSDDCFLGLV